MNRITKIGVWMITIGILIALVSVWWWALFGMKEEIGSALFVTGVVNFCVGMLTVFNGAEL